jgi:mannose-6-phosphate isomerase-like protein (cupin superfamily)
MDRKLVGASDGGHDGPAPGRAVQTFQYAKPAFAGARAIVELCEGENLRGDAHVLRPGAALVHDARSDALWFVVRGRARVLGARDTLIGEFGAGDGLLVPRDAPARLENAGPDDLEILEVSGFDRGRLPAPTEDADGDKVSRIIGRVL